MREKLTHKYPRARLNFFLLCRLLLNLEQVLSNPRNLRLHECVQLVRGFPDRLIAFPDWPYSIISPLYYYMLLPTYLPFEFFARRKSWGPVGFYCDEFIGLGDPYCFAFHIYNSEGTKPRQDN